MFFTIGADPEFILMEGNTYKSAIGVLPCRKQAVKKRGHLFYYENVVAECNLKPASTKQDFLNNISESLKLLAGAIRPLKFITKAACDFPAQELAHPDALRAACKEDWCAYDLMPRKAPETVIRDTPFRSAGGHIHIGSKLLEDHENIPPAVRMLDLFLSIPFVLIDHDKSSILRRIVYGQAGRHRITDYGFEYRTPNNYWLGSPLMAGVIYDLCQFVLEFVASNGHEKFWTFDERATDPSKAHVCYGYDADMLQNCINSGDKNIARKFMMITDNYLPSNLQKQVDRLIHMKPVDIYQAWGITTGRNHL